jgi:DNA-binding PadR family transcriptional regulator
MVKNVLLGLLASGSKHGYELKAEFERLLSGTWTLNTGQVYLTLGRLERDGLVSCEVVAQDTRPDRKVYSLTELGYKEVDRWTFEVVRDPVHLRDELVLKIVLQAVLQSTDATVFIADQRRQHLELLAELTALRDEPDQPVPTILVIEAGIAHIEADLRWLETVESMLSKTKGARGR